MPLTGDRGPWVQLCNRGQFFILDPRPGDFTVEAIAHGLACENRYGGQAPYPYSVALHSVFVSRWAEWLAAGAGASRAVQLVEAWCGLWHDASEGVGLKDIPTPVKRQLGDYAPLEDKAMRALAEQFTFSWPLTSAAAQADFDVYCAEVPLLYPGETRSPGWNPPAPPAELDLAALLVKGGWALDSNPATLEVPWRTAKRLWLDRYEKLNRYLNGK